MDSEETRSTEDETSGEGGAHASTKQRSKTKQEPSKYPTTSPSKDANDRLMAQTTSRSETQQTSTNLSTGGEIQSSRTLPQNRRGELAASKIWLDLNYPEIPDVYELRRDLVRFRWVKTNRIKSWPEDEPPLRQEQSRNLLPTTKLPQSERCPHGRRR